MEINRNSILVIDDDIKHLEFIDYLLKSDETKKILKTSNVPDAISILINQKIDLILTDYSMPDINGIEFRNMLKSIKRTSKIPVLFMSNYQLNEIPDCKEIEIANFIQKP
ncbi:MAG TPA: hypothetical protein DEH02_19740 [Bacteroidales bacterium]|nr:MAG: hypothetical protein A2X01_19870 [Bacteroidetes bacterium GWF2_35_48]OFY93203.1 MAG: hypothetical protein A2491_03090 [Bacteroidetes bacterium RIFOXYC12_FULL_35_7]HBX53298.1 hypothetical protein [Bacteroidales bacterium]